MTIRQKFLQQIYPVWMWFAKKMAKYAPIKSNSKNVAPPESFYELNAVQNNRMIFSFAFLKNKKVLIVNTASNCGYTNQYDDLEKLYQLKKDSLMIIAFPANDFKEQEKGDDEAIAEFCKINFGITFPIMQKTTVLKKPGQHAVFQWLTDAAKNGWNNKAPSWNFSKYLIDENGILINCFEPAVSPMSKEVLDATK